MSEERDDKTIYKVVLNHEEQYSIWPAHRENALGWNDAGKSGTKEECLAYIKEVWTDMRPLSWLAAPANSLGSPGVANTLSTLRQLSRTTSGSDMSHLAR